MWTSRDIRPIQRPEFRKLRNHPVERVADLQKAFMKNQDYDHIDHIIIYDTDRHRCKICHIKANFICKKCKVYLHPKICFEKYHSSDD